MNNMLKLRIAKKRLETDAKNIWKMYISDWFDFDKFKAVMDDIDLVVKDMEDVLEANKR